jgi:hypothetical protein
VEQRLRCVLRWYPPTAAPFGSGVCVSLSQGYNTGVFGKVTNNNGDVLKLLAKQKTATYIDSPVE